MNPIKIMFCASVFFALLGGNIEVIRWVSERSLTLGQGIGLAGLVGLVNWVVWWCCAVVVDGDE